MSEMLKSRMEMQELSKQYDIRPIPTPPNPPPPTTDEPDLESGQAVTPATDSSATAPSPLPDSVIVSMLRREALLTKAKLHYLVFEHLQQDKAVRSLKSQLKQVSGCR